jgi:hypothetical protein
MARSITLQQTLLIGLIMLSFAYIAEQLYEEYSTVMMGSNLASRLLLSSTEKLQRALTQQQTSLNILEQKIKQATIESPPTPALSSITREEESTGERNLHQSRWIR